VPQLSGPKLQCEKVFQSKRLLEVLNHSTLSLNESIRGIKRYSQPKSFFYCFTFLQEFRQFVYKGFVNSWLKPKLVIYFLLGARPKMLVTSQN